MTDVEDDWVRLAEAMIFASAAPVSRLAHDLFDPQRDPCKQQQQTLLHR